MDFLHQYFVEPIYSYSGYNVVNTTVYALLALLALYALYRLFKARRIPLGKDFFYGALAFTLFGSTKRVVTDAVDVGLFSGFPWDFYSYNVWNVSPFIYLFVAALFLAVYALEVFYRKEGLTWKVGLSLFLLHLLPLLPHVRYGFIAVASLAVAAAIYLLSRYVLRDSLLAFPPAAHSLDGVASVLAITLLSYGEQHVLANAIMSIHPWLFPIAKVAVALAFSHFLKAEKDPHLFWILLTAATVLGLAPGFRNALRASLGV